MPDEVPRRSLRPLLTVGVGYRDEQTNILINLCSFLSLFRIKCLSRNHYDLCNGRLDGIKGKKEKRFSFYFGTRRKGCKRLAEMKQKDGIDFKHNSIR